MLYDRLHNMNNLTSNEQSFRTYILEHPKQVVDCTINQLSELSFMSTTAIVRFCKKLGYKGFSDFKISLAIEINAFFIDGEKVEIDMPIENGASDDEIAKTFLNLHYQTLNAVYQSLDLKAISNAAKALHDAELVILKGSGESLIIAEDFHYKAMNIGMAVLSNPMIGFSNLERKRRIKKQIALIVTQSGQTRDVRQWVLQFHSQNIDICMICANKESLLLKTVKYPILVQNNEQRIMKMGTFASRTAMTYVLDIIYAMIFNMDYDENVSQLKHRADLIKSVESNEAGNNFQ